MFNRMASKPLLFYGLFILALRISTNPIRKRMSSCATVFRKQS